MPTIAEALEAQKVEALIAVVKGGDKASTKVTPEFRVTKKATDPNPGVALPRMSSEVDIDPESEAMIDALCFECGSRIQIDPSVPENVDAEVDRKFLCGPCGKHSLLDAIVAQRNVEVIRRSRVATHQPRVTDNIDHPVTTTRKEVSVFDVDNMSDAEIGATVRARLKDNLAKQIASRKPVVEKARAEAKVVVEQGITAEQVRRHGHVLPAFMVGTTLEVPALDLSAVPNLDEQPDSTERSPYNKARFRLTKESPLPVPDKDGLMEEGAVPTTYRVLEQEHIRLSELAADHNEGKVKAEPKDETTVEVIVADIQPDKMARLEALVATLRA